VVSTAVNIPSIEAEDMEVLGPFLPLATQLGRLAMALAEGSSVERIEAAFLGRIADFDTRLLTLAVIQGALQGRTEEQVNLVNAPAMAEERGIVVEEKSVSEAQDFHELIRVGVVAGGERVAVAGTGIGPGRVPHLVEVQGRRLTIELERFVTIFRYADVPGMIGRVGTIFGRHGINISSAAVGHTADGEREAHGEAGAGDATDGRGGGGGDAGGGGLAAMVVTSDVLVPPEVVSEIVASEGFFGGWSVPLG
jgi:D-3-phosphoglycerate dehydrogenase